MGIIDWGLMGFVAVNVLAAMSGAVFKPDAWYDALNKPSWNPPKWLFPIAWTVIFGLIALAGWTAYRAGGGFSGAPWAMAFYFIQLVFNAGWSAVFFGMRRPDLALVEVGFMFTAILITVILFFQVSAAAGWLMVPYLVWTGFAARLNHKIMVLNPRNATAEA
jgi:tryptophan-rich sensory protein